jgi:hypothetical protein
MVTVAPETMGATVVIQEPETVVEQGGGEEREEVVAPQEVVVHREVVVELQAEGETMVATKTLQTVTVSSFLGLCSDLRSAVR